MGAAQGAGRRRRVLTVIETARATGEKPTYQATMYVSPRAEAGAANEAGAAGGEWGEDNRGGGVRTLGQLWGMMKGVAAAVISPVKDGKRKRIVSAGSDRDIAARHRVVARKAPPAANPMAEEGAGLRNLF